MARRHRQETAGGPREPRQPLAQADRLGDAVRSDRWACSPRGDSCRCRLLREERGTLAYSHAGSAGGGRGRHRSSHVGLRPGVIPMEGSLPAFSRVAMREPRGAVTAGAPGIEGSWRHPRSSTRVAGPVISSGPWRRNVPQRSQTSQRCCRWQGEAHGRPWPQPPGVLARVGVWLCGAVILCQSRIGGLLTVRASSSSASMRFRVERAVVRGRCIPPFSHTGHRTAP